MLGVALRLAHTRTWHRSAEGEDDFDVPACGVPRGMRAAEHAPTIPSQLPAQHRWCPECFPGKNPVRHIPSRIQWWALGQVADKGNGAEHPDYVRANTLRSLRRRGWVTGCFDPLALTDEGRIVLGASSWSSRA